MNTKETLPLTRKAAVFQAISLLEKEGNHEEEIRILKKFSAGLPAVQWTKEVAADCIDNFLLEYGRLPTVTELAQNKELPFHTSFKYLFGMPARKWLEKRYSSTRDMPVDSSASPVLPVSPASPVSSVLPKTSRKRALLSAYRVLDGEARERIKDMLDEYPITQWNDKNMADCIVTYYEKYRRVPAEEEMKRSDELPYIGVFKYRWKTTYLQWLKERLPVLYRLYCDERTQQRDYADEFVREYKRIRPKNEADFNRKRNRALCCGTERVKRALNVTRWAELLSACRLEVCNGAEERAEIERDKIKSVRIIAVDCGENIFFRQYAAEEERRFFEEEG